MVVPALLDKENLTMRASFQHNNNSIITKNLVPSELYMELDNEVRDTAIRIAKEIFEQHGAKRSETSPMHVIDIHHCVSSFKSVKLLTDGGKMLQLRYELRLPFINWIIKNQILCLRRYEISPVYRAASGHSCPYRFIQGDFDIIGGAAAVTEAEAIKVIMDIATQFFHPQDIHIRVNHGQLMEAIWSWAGIGRELRQNVAECLSVFGSSCPHSKNRKAKWSVIRRRLLQVLDEDQVCSLETADLRFCGSFDEAFAELRGDLSLDELICNSLDELSKIFSILRVWNIDDQASLDVLMPPTENYYRGTFFQVYIEEKNSTSITKTSLLAIGGRYDHMVHQMWDHDCKSSPPSAVGVSIALEKILNRSPLIIRPSFDQGIKVLVCSKGGGGLLQECMELVAELWQGELKAAFVPLSEPNLKEQYDYAVDYNIKCLLIIYEAGLSPVHLYKVRHIETGKEKEIERGVIVNFLKDALSTNFENF